MHVPQWGTDNSSEKASMIVLCNLDVTCSIRIVKRDLSKP